MSATQAPWLEYVYRADGTFIGAREWAPDGRGTWHPQVVALSVCFDARSYPLAVRRPHLAWGFCEELSCRSWARLERAPQFCLCGSCGHAGWLGCAECLAIHEEYWQAMWDDYHSGRL